MTVRASTAKNPPTGAAKPATNAATSTAAAAAVAAPPRGPGRSTLDGAATAAATARTTPTTTTKAAVRGVRVGGSARPAIGGRWYRRARIGSRMAPAPILYVHH